jgi:hypothetical protein
MLTGMNDEFFMPCFEQGFADWGRFNELRSGTHNGNDFH